MADAFVRERVPADRTVQAVNRIVKLIVGDRSITKVDEVVERVGMGK